MKKFNVVEVEIEDISGKKVSKQQKLEIAKFVGNCIHNQSRDIALSNLARDIYIGKTVMITRDQVKTILKLLENDKTLAGFIYIAIVDELNNLIKKEN